MKDFRFYIWCFMMGLSSLTSAQSLEYGLGLGASIYWGDLNSPSFSSNLSNGGLAIQGVGRYVYNDYWSARFNIMYGRLSGDDGKSTAQWQLERNLNFTSSIFEFSGLGELHILGNNNLDGLFFSPYAIAGIGLFRFNPKTEYQGVTYALQPLGTEGQGMNGFPSKYSRVALAIPFGGGVKLRLNDQTHLNLELIGRRTFTDYIDDVSTNYVSYEDMLAGNGEIAARLGNRTGEFFGQSEPFNRETGSQRGGANVDDYYFSFIATITFKFGSGGFGFGKGSPTSECPTF